MFPCHEEKLKWDDYGEFIKYVNTNKRVLCCCGGVRSCPFGGDGKLLGDWTGLPVRIHWHHFLKTKQKKICKRVSEVSERLKFKDLLMSLCFPQL